MDQLLLGVDIAWLKFAEVGRDCFGDLLVDDCRVSLLISAHRWCPERCFISSATSPKQLDCLRNLSATFPGVLQALIESSFRRLLAALDQERDR